MQWLKPVDMSLSPYAIPVAKELEAAEDVLKTTLTSEVPLVTEVVQYIIQNGGKRLRPLLTLLAAKLSGYRGDAGPRLAAAMEMIHTASLLHDDVVDDASLRRGKASAKAKWGNSISILVGDFFWCKMSRIIVDHGSLRILKVVTDTITKTTEAEILEITRHSDFSIDEETYLKIIGGKTACLLAACCQVGAILGEVSENYEAALKRYGYDLGIAFQLADDILDYVSEEALFGKHMGGDLREGKLTFPLIVALRRADGEEAKIVKNAMLGGHIGAENLKAVLGIIQRYDGMERTRELAARYVEKAKKHLEPFKGSLEKESLLGLADYVVERDE
ncbi:MAG: polyprenyl synthetase family protein [Deltaproteobacteria bacterium]|nr:polyprenyl synthetase family protein [Deltaproteobacteria bacterium]